MEKFLESSWVLNLLNLEMVFSESSLQSLFFLIAQEAHIIDVPVVHVDEAELADSLLGQFVYYGIIDKLNGPKLTSFMEWE